MEKFIFSPIYIFLIGLLNSLIVPIIGELSGSFFLILLSIAGWINQIDKKDRIVRTSFKLFMALIAVQIVTDVFHDTLFIDKLKGVAIVINGMIFFFFFLVICKKNIDLIKWFVLGTVISPFLFSSSILYEEGYSYSAEDVTYFKFVIVPLITNLFAVMVLFTKRREIHKKLAIAMFSAGALCIVLGARSGGFMMLAAGGIYYYLKRKRLTIRILKRRAIRIGIIVYLCYAAIYVPLVMSGSLNAGNSSQLQKSSNPYNPIELLKFGRTDSLVPFYAFLDNPITGWGYLAMDPHHKYATLLFNLSDGENIEKAITHYDKIPGHSVLFYFACAYGFMALIIVGRLYYRSARATFYSLLCDDRYLLYRLLCLTTVTWHFLFSPMPHFKYLPAYFAFLIVSSTKATKIIKAKYGTRK